MAEAFAVAASVFQVAGAGVKLTKVLYEFAATISAANEEIEDIAKNVSLYASVLQSLSRRLKSDKAVHSVEGLKVAQELETSSHELFKKIKKLLPKGKWGHNHSLSKLEKVKWSFKKVRVAYFVGQLEYLKSTVSLLVQILFTAELSQEKAPAAAQKKGDSKPKVKAQTSSKHEFIDEELHIEVLAAGNLVIERQVAHERLHELKRAAQQSPEDVIAQPEDGKVTDTSLVLYDPEAATESIRDVLVKFAHVEGKAKAVTSKTLVVSHRTTIVAHLLQTWTTLSPEAFPVRPPNQEEDQPFDQVDVEPEIKPEPVKALPNFDQELSKDFKELTWSSWEDIGNPLSTRKIDLAIERLRSLLSYLSEESRRCERALLIEDRAKLLIENEMILINRDLKHINTWWVDYGREHDAFIKRQDDLHRLQASRDTMIKSSPDSDTVDKLLSLKKENLETSKIALQQCTEALTYYTHRAHEARRKHETAPTEFHPYMGVPPVPEPPTTNASNQLPGSASGIQQDTATEHLASFTTAAAATSNGDSGGLRRTGSFDRDRRGR